MGQIYRIHKSGLVAAPIEAVYQVAADVGAYPEFLTGLSWVRVKDGIISMAVQAGPISVVWHQTATFDPPTAITFRQVKGPFRWLRGGWRFLVTDGGTCASYFSEFEIDLPLPGMGRMIQRNLEHHVEQALAAFPRRLATLLHRDTATLQMSKCPFHQQLVGMARSDSGS